MSTKKDPGMGFRLNEYRRLKKYTLQQLGENIGLSHSSLSSIENGKTLPSAETLKNLCQHTDIDIVWLLTGKRQKTAQPTAAFLAALETWARESAKGGGIEWLEDQLETYFPAFRLWREKNAETNAETDQDKVA